MTCPGNAGVYYAGGNAMETFDVFIWIQGDDAADAALAAGSLKKRLKVDVQAWHIVGPRGERFERLGYDLGMRYLTRPESLCDLGTLVQGQGGAEYILVWSGSAVLTADWHPWQSGKVRVWEPCPAAILSRQEVPGISGASWYDWQGASKLPKTNLPMNQVKVVGPEDWEQAIQSGGRPFGPSVVVLEKPQSRRPA